jgi:hypothetical protein
MEGSRVHEPLTIIMNLLRLSAMIMLLGQSGHVLAGPGLSGMEAIRAVVRERGTVYLNRVVQCRGEHGADQPEAWRVVASDPSDTRGGLREFFVNASGVVTEGTLSGGAAVARLPLKSVKTDSTVAFRLAEGTARQARVGFHVVDYQLMASGSPATPVWQMRLQDAMGRTVGEVAVSASSGRVLRAQWFRVVENPPQESTGNAAGTSAEELWYRTREVAGRGAGVVRDGISRAGTWIRGKVRRDGVSEPYYIPPPGPGPDRGLR